MGENLDAIRDPRRMPALRVELLRVCRDNGSYHSAEMQRELLQIMGRDGVWDTDEAGNPRMTSPHGYDIEVEMAMARRRADHTMYWHRTRLDMAQLIHVTPDLCDVVEGAAAAVPDELVVNEWDAPALAGLVVFGRPMWGTDSGAGGDYRRGQPIRVDALLWGSSALPVAGEPQNTLTMSMFRFVDHDHEDMERLIADRGLTNLEEILPIWFPLGRSDMFMGRPVGEFAGEEETAYDDVAKLSVMEDRRLVVALWAVLNQRRLVESHTVVPDRPMQRRLARRGYTAPMQVQVVHLRRTERAIVPHSEGRGVRVRFPVRPHYRRQPFGPGRQQRKIVLVPGHWKGPVDAPVVHTERIWELDR